MNDKSAGVPNPADFFGWLNQMMSQNPVTSPASDPMKMWQNMAQQNQEAFVKFWQQMMSGQGITNAVNNPATASYRALLKQTAKAYLEAADMPTRDDIIRLGEQISALNGKLDDVSEGTSSALSNLPPILGQIVTTLESLSVRLERLETKIDNR